MFPTFDQLKQLNHDRMTSNARTAKIAHSTPRKLKLRDR